MRSRARARISPVLRAAVRPCLVLALAALAAGCVERRLLIRADPIGAEVVVDGAVVGCSGRFGPIEVPFEHYGIRRVVVRAPGHVPEARLVTLDPPWWQLFPIDLVTDVLVPWTIEDEREVALALVRRAPPVRREADEAERRALAFAAEAERRP